MSTPTSALPGAAGDELAPLMFGLSLAGRRVVAVGGGRVTARRVGDLIAAGALVEVIAPELDASLLERTDEFTWTARPYAGPADLDGAWLVHVATGDRAVDAWVSDDAHDQRIWCVAAGFAIGGTAQVPARGTVPTATGPISIAVHASRDPRRAVHVRDALQHHLADRAVAYLASGVVDLRARRDVLVRARQSIRPGASSRRPAPSRSEGVA